DPVSGAIHWPDVLQGEAYDANRASLQDIFTRRAQNDLGDGTYLKVRHLTDSFETQLDTQVQALPPQDFVDAKRFLHALAEAVHDDASVASGAPPAAAP